LGRALTTYLQDHLAGAIHAIELLKALRDHHAGKPLGQFATELLIETEADRDFAIEWRPVPLPLRFETHRAEPTSTGRFSSLVQGLK
jgi:hypothetical protein